MVAVIDLGKQFTVEAGMKLTVPRQRQVVGETITLPDLLSGRPVTVRIIEHIRGPKIVVRKFRPKTRYQRTKGHRQPHSLILVEAIGRKGGGNKL